MIECNKNIINEPFLHEGYKPIAYGSNHASRYTHAKCLVAQSCLTLCDPMDYSPPGSSVHGNSPGKNTGVGCHALLQGIFPTRTEIRSLSLQVDSLHLSHQGSLGIE